MKIACPNCSTKYTLKEQALGASGRKMKCVKCEHVWLALLPEEVVPEARPVESLEVAQGSNIDQVSEGWDEAQWDKDLAAEIAAETEAEVEAEAAKNIKNKPVSHYETSGEAKEKRSLRYLAKRAQTFVKGSANAIWTALLWLKGLNLKEQIAVAIGLLMPLALVGGVYASRERLVHQFPDLASLYESVGIGVNLQGLAFEDIRTIRRPENGVAVLVVEGVIRNITHETKEIPQLHFILSGRNREVYSWQDKTADKQLPSGARVEFRTVLASPPDVADRLHVRFFSKNARLNRL